MALTSKFVTALTEKTALASNDLFAVADSADSYKWKKAKQSNVASSLGVILKDGTVAFTGDQSMGGNQITNLGAPVLGTDAVTKDYADALVGTTTGWTDSGASYLYGGTQTITATGVDLTGILGPMDKIQLDNNGTVKYFYVVDVSFSTNTTINLAGEVDLAAGTITDVKYSHAERPEGFKDGRTWYFARAHSTTVTSLVNGLYSQIVLDNVLNDPNSNFAANEYTVPVSGTYQISIQSGAQFNTLAAETSVDMFVAADVDGDLGLVVGNRVAVSLASLDFNINASTGTATVSLTKGQVVGLYTYQTNGLASAVNSVTSRFYIQFLHV